VVGELLLQFLLGRLTIALSDRVEETHHPLYKRRIVKDIGIVVAEAAGNRAARDDARLRAGFNTLDGAHVDASRGGQRFL
jgi:hypothetical protein